MRATKIFALCILLLLLAVTASAQDKSIVAKTISNADEAEVTLADGVVSDALLKKLICAGAHITKFEEIEPSLNDIFIEKVSA